jgi:hypothetical protein
MFARLMSGMCTRCAIAVVAEKNGEKGKEMKIGRALECRFRRAQSECSLNLFSLLRDFLKFRGSREECITMS